MKTHDVYNQKWLQELLNIHNVCVHFERFKYEHFILMHWNKYKANHIVAVWNTIWMKKLGLHFNEIIDMIKF